uniref:Actinoporin-like protein n=1 Tax=Oryzias sinensis TaxID=183150 RepID=A0A8C8A0B2_9TELE
TMSETAESVAANLKSRRNVTIEITNLSNNHLAAVTAPPQPTVRPEKTEVCNFGKTSSKATGAVGVLTYELFERHSNKAQETMALMFSVPYDYNVYKNWFGVGIYQQGKECNKSLYEEMYFNKEQQGFVREEAKGSGLTFHGNRLEIKATMSPMGKAIMKVEVGWDSSGSPMTPNGGAVLSF